MPRQSSASTPLPHVAEFLAHLAVERGLAQNTVDAYRRDLADYAGFLGAGSLGAGHVGPSSREAGFGASPPDAAAVAGYVESLRSQGRSPTTIARRVAAVRGYHAFLVAEGFATEDPTVLLESPRRGDPLPKALEVDDVFSLLEAPDSSTVGGRRDRALLEFLYATGARVSETTGLDQTDLDLDDGVVVLTGKGDRQRMVPVGRSAIEAIRRYLPDRLALRGERSDDGAMFLNLRGRRLTRQGVWGIVAKAADRAGIAGVSPHVLRHSMATHLVQGGADLRTVQEILGHASISTTQVYTRVSPQHLIEVYVAAHPRSRFPVGGQPERG